MNTSIQNHYHRRPRGTQRYSLFELGKSGCANYHSMHNTPTASRNSSVQYGSNKQIPTVTVMTNPKQSALTFSKRHSRRSIKSKESKENKQADTSIEQGKGLFFSGTLPKKHAHKSKFAFESIRTSQLEDFSVSDLEKELQGIIEQNTKKQNKNVSMGNFEILEKLGSGSFSNVYLVLQKYTRCLYALKTMKKQTVIKEDVRTRLASELKIQMYCQHPNIARLYGIFQDEENIYLIQQYAGKENLFNFFRRRKQKKCDELISNVIAQLSSAVKYLHEHSIIHRDIKPENVLIGPGGIVKLTDFGWSVHNPGNVLRSTFCGTPIYLSPELLESKEYDETVDIWAIGVLTYELLTGQNPFKIKRLEELQKIVSDNIQFGSIKNPLAANFTRKLLRKNPTLRTSMLEVISHPFLTIGKKYVIQ